MPSGEQIAELEQASAMAAEVTTAMFDQKMQLEDNKRTVKTLQKALVGGGHSDTYTGRVLH